MKSINNRDAYFAKLIQNSNKNEYRANDNAGKYITPVGDEIYKKAEVAAEDETDRESIEHALSMMNTENWLMFIENKQLYKGLLSLKDDDVQFLFEMLTNGFTHNEMASRLNTSRAAISMRYGRIIKKLKHFF